MADEYVITSLGDEKKGETAAAVRPGSRLPAVVEGSPLLRNVVVRAAAVAHGAKQAVAPETVFRAAMAARRELKALRKERKRVMKEALKEYRARHRAGEGSETGTGEDD